MQRRKVIKAGLWAGAWTGVTALCKSPAWAQGGNDLEVRIDTSRTGRVIPETFTGLSYELAQLTEPTFFSGSNKELIAFFRRLSPHGVLRIGGNSSEFCWFRATPETSPIQLRLPPGNLKENWMPHRTFAIEPVAVDHLSDFLKATGWKAIYGLNYGNSTPERAATEAAYVHARLGADLLFFQIGNEPDFYRDANNGVRPSGWGFEDYVREWVAYADAVSSLVPTARFGGPDTGASSDWVLRFGEQVAPKLGDRLAALTGHYYAEGPPDAPTTTTAKLLAGDPKVISSTAEIVRVADAHALVYRMTEGNSCYRGGKPGMSNAFAATLWAADYLLTLASLGCAGVNLHGGKASFLAASLGDHNPGLAVPNGVHKRSNGFYTPISSEDGEAVAAMPVFYGMMFAQCFVGAQMLELEQPSNPSVRVFAATRGGRLIAAVVNKSTTPATVILKCLGRPPRRFRMISLSAPGLDSEAVQFGRESVEPKSARWQPRDQEERVGSGGLVRIAVGAGATLLEEI